jgi:hypothetical protein
MVFLHQVLFIQFIVGELSRFFVPNHTLAREVTNVAQLSYRCHVRSFFHGTIQLTHFSGADDGDEVFPMFIEAVIRRLNEGLAYFVFALSFFHTSQPPRLNINVPLLPI